MCFFFFYKELYHFMETALHIFVFACQPSMFLTDGGCSGKRYAQLSLTTVEKLQMNGNMQPISWYEAHTTQVKFESCNYTVYLRYFSLNTG